MHRQKYLGTISSVYRQTLDWWYTNFTEYTVTGWFIRIKVEGSNLAAQWRGRGVFSRLIGRKLLRKCYLVGARLKDHNFLFNWTALRLMWDNFCFDLKKNLTQFLQEFILIKYFLPLSRDMNDSVQCTVKIKGGVELCT